MMTMNDYFKNGQVDNFWALIKSLAIDNPKNSLKTFLASSIKNKLSMVKIFIFNLSPVGHKWES